MSATMMADIMILCTNHLQHGNIREHPRRDRLKQHVDVRIHCIHLETLLAELAEDPPIDSAPDDHPRFVSLNDIDCPYIS
jgi:hypothetical protein